MSSRPRSALDILLVETTDICNLKQVFQKMKQVVSKDETTQSTPFMCRNIPKKVLLIRFH